ncbi:MAG TPA: acyl-CoA dehydrogenase [Nevskiaceae bacterium]|nr:acyl-CoA dehydrogenase [Nevskiaceae bacterium]
MDFEAPEQRRMLADTLERYLSEQYPFATRQRIAGGGEGFDRKQWQTLVDIGALGVLFPEDAGGLGGDAFDVQTVFTALGHALVVEPFLDALMVGRALLAADDTTRLATVVDGTCLAALAHDEPGSHYETTQVQTRATHGPAGWTLNGAKTVVRNAAHADFFLLSARTSATEAAAAGITLFAVPRGAAGVSIRSYPRIDGGRAGEVALADVQLAEDACVGGAGHGAALLAAATDWGLLALCAEAIGAMDFARDQTLDYLRTRKQFGVPIGSFQALQHRMVNVLIDIEQARSAVINAAAAMTAGAPARGRALSAAKYTIGEVGTRVAEECIQLHGGIGMTWELPLAHYAKRLVMINHELGDDDHHLQRYIELTATTA